MKLDESRNLGPDTLGLEIGLTGSDNTYWLRHSQDLAQRIPRRFDTGKHLMSVGDVKSLIGKG